jgi:hypothetical protein
MEKVAALQRRLVKERSTFRPNAVCVSPAIAESQWLDGRPRLVQPITASAAASSRSIRAQPCDNERNAR